MGSSGKNLDRDTIRARFVGMTSKSTGLHRSRLDSMGRGSPERSVAVRSIRRRFVAALAWDQVDSTVASVDTQMRFQLSATEGCRP